MSDIISIISGDIFELDNSDRNVVIGHGVNKHGVMGGLASVIDRNFPNQAQEYRDRIGENPVGGYIISEETDEESDMKIVHLIAQDEPGANVDGRMVQTSVFRALVALGKRNVDVLRLPLMGAGIGGLTVEQSVFHIYAGVLSASHPVYNAPVVEIFSNDSDMFREADDCLVRIRKSAEPIPRGGGDDHPESDGER